MAGRTSTTRNEGERRFDSTLGNTIYEKQQVYGEQIPPLGIHIALDQRWRTASWPKRSRRNAAYLVQASALASLLSVIFIKVAK